MEQLDMNLVRKAEVLLGGVKPFIVPEPECSLIVGAYIEDDR